MIKKIVFTFLGLIPFIGNAQNADVFDFQIEGKINMDTGTVNIEMDENKALYPNDSQNFVVKIKDGKFIAFGKTKYPIWLSFRVGARYTSKGTAIMPGKQRISLNVDSNNNKPENNNLVMLDEKKYNDFMKNALLKTQLYRNHYDSLKNIYHEKFPEQIEYLNRIELKESYAVNDTALLQFVKANPNSYYGILKLYHLVDFGYNQTLGKVYDSFSSRLKNSIYGELLLEKIAIAKQISVGSKLPVLIVKDQSGAIFDIKAYSKKKFILIDLWYSHCAPCIAQFSDMKNIYKQFSDKGFEILAISTDKEKYIADWKSAIVKYELPWPQYLDLNGIVAHSFNIRIYPSNLLINQKGEIIATDLSPAELNHFLGERL
ncbi:TlpA disulfide reductase family protein [Pedobacter sp. R20-19]|uniref:TlpA family protein disulfide reductase n=1 Tax=Pedobacter sp. R20-19 TaxID=1270196 RepID=UPI0004939D99|nr:TlpA disulfide reductase family protein [Pedobacter sp. R20-19]